MASPDKSEAFYKKLKSQLQDTALWPSEYLYKFIVTTDTEKIAKIESLVLSPHSLLISTGHHCSPVVDVTFNRRVSWETNTILFVVKQLQFTNDVASKYPPVKIISAVSFSDKLTTTLSITATNAMC